MNAVCSCGCGVFDWNKDFEPEEQVFHCVDCGKEYAKYDLIDLKVAGPDSIPLGSAPSLVEQMLDKLGG